LFDLGFSGPAYTWTNKRFSSTPIFERLDRCLANAEWCSLFPNTNVFNLLIILGDHAPILISTESTFHRPKLQFKFENWWTYEEDFWGVAKNAWNASINKSFHARTTNLAGTLKRWCKKKKPIQQQLNSIQERINEIQMKPPQLQDHNREVSLIAQYEESVQKNIGQLKVTRILPSFIMPFKSVSVEIALYLLGTIMEKICMIQKILRVNLFIISNPFFVPRLLTMTGQS
jgi:hypothetical protein